MDLESSPSFMPSLAVRFQTLIWSCIDAELFWTAIFYAERYFAMDPGHDARHLYATALLRAGQVYTALNQVNIPAGLECSGCLELKARCSTALGRHRQAHDALEEAMRKPAYPSYANCAGRSSRLFPDEASIHCRSGSMALKGNLRSEAGASFRQALALNPLLWEAFEGLCALGSVPEIDDLFPPRPPPVRRATEVRTAKLSASSSSDAGFFTPELPPQRTTLRHTQPFRIPSGTRDSIIANEPSFFPDTTFQQAHRTSRSQPVVGSAHLNVSRPLSSADEAGPVPKKLRSTVRLPEGRTLKSVRTSGDEPVKKSILNLRGVANSGKNANAPTNASGTRRSTRLLSGMKPSTRDRRRPANTGRSPSIDSEMDDDAIGRGEPSPPSVAQSPKSEGSPPPNHDPGTDPGTAESFELEQADHYLYELMRRFASAHKALTIYECERCIQELEQLPPCHQKSPWVVAMVGRAHYERLDYAAADRAFRALRVMDPTRLWDMEVYSSLLWHMHNHVELSFLGQELLNVNPRSAQAWIAIGNLFSLKKDHSQALTCFRRAADLDPSCAYAFTLSGHECLDEDPEKAIHFFQSALRVDARSYNAWYGLGTCYLRQSKLRLAEYHYRKAVEIHPYNAVLLGCVGIAVERRGDRNEALVLFNRAVQLSSDNALVRYRRSKILIMQKKYEAAIQDLEHLMNTVPDEANVIFQLAKVYRLVGNEVKSAQLLASARDIAPKSIHKIKKLLETTKDESVTSNSAGEEKMDEG